MTSIWLDDFNNKVTSSLNKDIDVDVLIVGGGITGLSTAYQLINSNLRIALIEKNIIAHGVTARTTGKLTYLQELVYSDLIKTYNEDKAKMYLKSQIEAIKLVENIVKKNKIDCDLENASSYVFTNDNNDLSKINDEYEILKNFGIKISEATKLPDKEKVKYAIYVKDTKVFHPIKYLMELKDICQKNKIDIYEKTKLLSIDKNENKDFICLTDKNIIKAKKVVLACHYPYFLFPFLMPLKTHLEKSYICAYKINKNLNFSAITATKPTLSIRYHKNYKIVLSNSHNLAFKNNDKENFDNLISTLKIEPDYLWSNKDVITSDKLPYIGLIEDNLYLATGYNTWGMTNATIAGKIISDMVLNRKNEYIQLFNPKRGFNLNQVISYPINIFSNVKSFIETKINKNKSWYDNNIKFITKDGKNIAIYTDENNIEHKVYNVCPHLKCSLLFNEVEKTWDCPCHGSRFDIDGKCIEGPSNYDIIYKE